MKQRANLKLEKKTIAILTNKARSQKQGLITDETGIGGILASLVEVCTSLTR